MRPFVPKNVERMVQISLEEDIGSGDITAFLIPENQNAEADIITHEKAVFCGMPWANAVFHHIDPAIQIKWLVKEGELIEPHQKLAELSGQARSLLTGERTALNWLQTLSGTATETYRYVQQLKGTKTQLLDTRKTIPGLRDAQKYAVCVGGGKNHRMGLYDAYLIKENHIISCGSIASAIRAARQLHPQKPVEIEVENLDELNEALNEGVERILLDNFTLENMREAVKMNRGRAELEVSGGVNFDNIRQIAETGVNFISVGSLTKHVKAIDLSMRFRNRSGF